MSDWQFQAVKLTAGVPTLVELSERQAGRRGLYVGALRTATGSNVSRPPFSGYQVRASLGRPRETMVAAGNREYGLCQALHGEEFAVAAYRSVNGNGGGDFVLGFAAHAPGGIPKSCGNCRDIMRDDLGTELDIVTGHPDGGIATVLSMRQYLVDTFAPSPEGAPDLGRIGLDSRHLSGLALTAWEAGQGLVNDAFSPEGVHEERKYAVALITERDTYFGARQVVCDYHPIYAIEDAIRAAERSSDTFLTGVVVVSSDPTGSCPPDVMYRDRQHLHDFNLQAELVLDREQDPPVYLVTLDSGKVTGIWRTTVKEWLPLAFSPRNFADMTHLAAYYKKRFL